MKKVLNIALLISFAATVMVPLTGIHIHKLAAVVFLLLSVVHILVHRGRMGTKRWLLLGWIIAMFATGVLGLILEQYPIILLLHRAGSILLVFFLAIHIFVFRKNLL